MRNPAERCGTDPIPPFRAGNPGASRDAPFDGRYSVMVHEVGERLESAALEIPSAAGAPDQPSLNLTASMIARLDSAASAHVYGASPVPHHAWMCES